MARRPMATKIKVDGSGRETFGSKRKPTTRFMPTGGGSSNETAVRVPRPIRSVDRTPGMLSVPVIWNGLESDAGVKGTLSDGTVMGLNMKFSTREPPGFSRELPSGKVTRAWSERGKKRLACPVDRSPRLKVPKRDSTDTPSSRLSCVEDSTSNSGPIVKVRLRSDSTICDTRLQLCF